MKQQLFPAALEKRETEHKQNLVHWSMSEKPCDFNASGSTEMVCKACELMEHQPAFFWHERAYSVKVYLVESNGSWKAFACLHGSAMSKAHNSQLTNSGSKVF